MKAYAKFLEEFLGRLRWQVEKGLDVDPEYRYLIDFQRHVTQASVEKPAVDARFSHDGRAVRTLAERQEAAGG